jgi:hypothetical protein
LICQILQQGNISQCRYPNQKRHSRNGKRLSAPLDRATRFGQTQGLELKQQGLDLALVACAKMQ